MAGAMAFSNCVTIVKKEAHLANTGDTKRFQYERVHNVLFFVWWRAISTIHIFIVKFMELMV